MNNDTPSNAADAAPSPPDARRLAAANCSPAAQHFREEIWKQFSDWWTGRENRQHFEKVAFMAFSIGFEAGEMANAPMKIMRERLLNWWRCDGGMDTLGEIMDDLEATTNPGETP